MEQKISIQPLMMMSNVWQDLYNRVSYTTRNKNLKDSIIQKQIRMHQENAT